MQRAVKAEGVPDRVPNLVQAFVSVCASADKEELNLLLTAGILGKCKGAIRRSVAGEALHCAAARRAIRCRQRAAARYSLQAKSCGALAACHVSRRKR